MNMHLYRLIWDGTAYCDGRAGWTLQVQVCVSLPSHQSLPSDSSIYEGLSGAAGWLPGQVITEHGGSQSHQRSMTKAGEGESAKSEGEVEGGSVEKDRGRERHEEAEM